MADSKISQLTPITGANILDSDEFIIARPDTFENFAVTRAEMFLDTPAITTSEVTTDAATVNGNITVTGTVDGRDVAADGSKLDGIEALADVTDTTNVTAAGALMDSELTSEASVKALDQGVSTTDSPDFAGLTVDTDTLYVDSANNRVGIRTSSPEDELEVSSALPIIRLTDSDTSAYGRVASTDGDLLLQADRGNTAASSNIRFDIDSSEVMRIDSSGALLIGKSVAGAGGDGMAANAVPVSSSKDSDTITRVVFDLADRFGGVDFFEFMCMQRRNAAGGYDQIDTGKFLVFVSNQDVDDTAWSVETHTVHSSYSDVSVSNNYANKTITFTFTSSHPVTGIPAVSVILSN